jgi:hypothetical protein
LLRSDGFVNEDGWYVDDINLIVYEYVPQSTEPITSVYNYSLQQNYPNPFNPSTKIKYSVSQRSNVVIKVFDILGNEIETLVNEEKSAGTYELKWNGENLPSGVYFYQLKATPSGGQAGSFIETKKMVLLR